MRSLFWLWILFLLVCLVADSSAYWVLRGRLGQSLELALDAALVAGVAEDDLIWGRQLSREDRAARSAEDILKRNLAGPLADTLVFRFSLEQSQEQVWAEGQAKVVSPYLLGALVGRGHREIEVNRKMRYQGSYK